MTIFFTILFIQSGVDKVINFNDNLLYFKDHFKNTFFRNRVRLLLIFITLIELLTGLICAHSFFDNLLKSNGVLIQLQGFFISQVFVLFTIICLFFGQRVAKDYAGAVNLGIYFIIALLGLALPLFFVSFL